MVQTTFYGKGQFPTSVGALRERQLRASMSREGDCLHHAPMENFFHTLKTALVHHQKYADGVDAQRDLFAFIEGFYNRMRFHSAIGYISQVEMERKTT